jgi:two-component system cell cycle response regulator DivK
MTKTILIIEDNEENLDLFSALLKCGGYRTLEAKNGSEGVRLAFEEKPHLILMDIQMPVMDGWETIKILRDEPSTRDIPSIALTSDHVRGDRQRFIKLGFDDYIPKPVTLKEFMKIVEEHLNRRLTGNNVAE